MKDKNFTFCLIKFVIFQNKKNSETFIIFCAGSTCSVYFGRFRHLHRCLDQSNFPQPRPVLGELAGTNNFSRCTSFCTVRTCTPCRCLVRPRSSIIGLQYWCIWKSGKKNSKSLNFYI